VILCSHIEEIVDDTFDKECHSTSFLNITNQETLELLLLGKISYYNVMKIADVIAISTVDNITGKRVNLDVVKFEEIDKSLLPLKDSYLKL
jgi:hypothetical protein